MPGSPEYEEGVGMISDWHGLAAPLDVVDMRYFIGPDPPWIIEPFHTHVERWYVKARLADDASFAGRWLVEARTERVRGISAVAPFESSGYDSPDWRGFVGEGPPREIPGLPGLWAGIDYDFVTGEGDTGMPGLPDEVTGCLEGT